MKSILITSKHFQSALHLYKKDFKKNKVNYDVIKSKQVVPKSKIINIIHKYDGIICSDDQLDREVLSKAKKLKVISKWGVGINTIDYKFARKNKIKVKNCKNVFSESTSNYVIGMILNITRKIHLGDQDIKNNIWNQYEGSQLSGKTLGIVGCGNIGSEIVKKSYAFGLKILVNDVKKIKTEFLKKYDARQVSLNSIFGKSDIISINTDLNATSRNLINIDLIKKSKKKPIIINCARGGIINEKDMFLALDKGIISNVGVDCFEDEPPKISLKLNKYKGSIFGCHNAFYTKEAVKKTHDQVYINLISNL